MKSIEVQFYEFCIDNDIEINDTPSASTIAKVKLAMENQNKNFNISDYYAAYKQGEAELIRLNDASKAEEKLLPIFNMGAIRNNFNSLSGRDRNIAIIKSHINNFSVAYDEMYNLGSGLTKRESSWAIMGGIASGLAGGAVGLAVATDIQRKNAQIKADNAEIIQMRARYLYLAGPKLNVLKDEKSRLENMLKKAEIALVEDSQQDVYFSKLSFNKPSIYFFSDNRYVIFADFSKEDTIIYNDVVAEIDGLISAEIYDGEILVSTVDVSLPLFNAKTGFDNRYFDNNKLSYDDNTYVESFSGTVISSGVFNHDFVNKPIVKFVNKKLWAIEKFHTHTEKSSIKYTQSTDLLDFISENNKHVVFATIQKKNAILEQAINLVKNASISNDDFTKLDYYKKAIDILKSIPEWKNSSELLKDCEESVLNTSNKIISERDRKYNDKKSKIKKYLFLFTICIAIVVIAYLAISIFSKTSKYKSAMEDISEQKLYSAYTALIELGEFKDSNIIAEDIKAKAEIELATQKNVKETIYYGSYEQDGDISNGTEPIEWIILTKENTKILVMSKYALDAKQFDEKTYESLITWENSDIREWLNQDFYNNAFNNEEQSHIINTTLTEDNTFEKDSKLYYEENYGESEKSITDNIFLLSHNEAQKYKLDKCEPTKYAQSNAVQYENDNGTLDDWITRSINIIYIKDYYGNLPTEPNSWVYTITEDNNISVYSPHLVRGILPAMWLDISSVN